MFLRLDGVQCHPAPVPLAVVILFRLPPIVCVGDVGASGSAAGLHLVHLATPYGGEPLTADGGKADLVVSKYDKYGNPIWSLRAGDSSNQYGAKMVVDAEGNLILLGRIYGSVDFGGGPRSSKGAGDILVVKLDGETLAAGILDLPGDAMFGLVLQVGMRLFRSLPASAAPGRGPATVPVRRRDGECSGSV